MRFKRIQAKCFGRLMDAKIEDLDQRPVILCAPNEGGKSTWFRVIETLLYGFNPAKPDNHPYTCWDGGNMDLSADMVLGNGQDMEVSRRMLATPRGQLALGGDSDTIGNKPLPMLDHVSRDIFSGIYALGIEDMQIFKDKTWDTIQDRLLSNFGADFLNTPRDVLLKLESDANQLWRSDKRGRNMARDIEEQIAKLKQERGAALKRYEEIRSLDEQKVQVTKEIEQQREILVDIKSKLRRAERLNPVRKKNLRIDELKGQVGDPQALQAVPDDIDRQLKRIAESLSEQRTQKDKLLKEVEILKNSLYKPKEAEKALLAQKSQLKTLMGERGLYTSDRASIEDLTRGMDRIRDQHRMTAEEILTMPWDEALEKVLKSISKAELAGAIRASKDAQQELRKVEQEKAGVEAASKALNSPVFPKASIGMLLFSGVVLLLGLILSVGILTGLGGVFAAVSLSSVLSWYRLRSDFTKSLEQHKGITQAVDVRLAKAEEDVKKQRKHLEEVLKGLPVATVYLKNPEEGLLSGFEGLLQSLKAMEDIEKESTQIHLRYEERIQRLLQIAGHRENFQATLPEQWIAVLEDELQEIEEKVHRSQTSQRDIDRLERELGSIQQRRDKLVQQEQDLHLLLFPFGEDDIQTGIENVLRRKRSYFTLMDALKDLKKDYPDYLQIMDEIESVDTEFEWIFSDEEIERAKQRIEEIDQEVLKMEKQKLQDSNDIRQLEKEKALDAIDSELEMLREQLDRTLKKRDSLELLRTIVQRADQHFREQHQPDVLRNAGVYLDIITDGRYNSLYFDDVDGTPILMAKMQGNQFPIPVSHPLSRGTLDQIYLSLRLSLMDHLDKDKETLPLCMDEILVNWDAQRLDAGLRLIDKIAQNRQIFLFTCHPWLADAVATKCSAQVIAL